jgi:hypothetical protein
MRLVSSLLTWQCSFISDLFVTSIVLWQVLSKQLRVHTVDMLRALAALVLSVSDILDVLVH